MEPLFQPKSHGRRHDKVYGRRRQLPEVRQAHLVLFGGGENNEQKEKEKEVEKGIGELSLNDKEPTVTKESVPRETVVVSTESEQSKSLPKQSRSSNRGSTTKGHKPRQNPQEGHRDPGGSGSGGGGGGGSIHLTASERRHLMPLLSHPTVHSHIVSFPAFGSRLLSKFEVRKSGEGSFSECLLLKHKQNPSDVAVLKIIPFNLSTESGSCHGDDDEEGKEEEESTITNSTVSAVLREIKILSSLSDYHGFAAVRSCHIVRGPWHQGFLEAYHAFREAHPDLALNPLPSERWDDEMIYGVIEMDNAGLDLEKLQKPSAFQVYDAFWMTTVLLAVVEMELEFEHRDLHMSNILYREHIPGKGLDISQDVVASMTDPQPDVLLGLSNLKITIIDYTMSRLKVKPSTTTTTTGNNDDNDDDGVLFNPDSVWSNANSSEEDTEEDDHQARTGRRIHRLVSLHHGNNNNRSSSSSSSSKNKNKWHAYIPATTTLWLAHILHNLLQQAGSRPRHVPGSSPAAKKLQTRIWKQLRELLALIDRDNLDLDLDLDLSGAVGLLNLGIEKGWISERDIQVFKDRLNDES